MRSQIGPHRQISRCHFHFHGCPDASRGGISRLIAALCGLNPSLHTRYIYVCLCTYAVYTLESFYSILYAHWKWSISDIRRRVQQDLPHCLLWSWVSIHTFSCLRSVTCATFTTTMSRKWISAYKSGSLTHTWLMWRVIKKLLGLPGSEKGKKKRFWHSFFCRVQSNPGKWIGLWLHPWYLIIFLSVPAVRAQLRNDPKRKRRNEGHLRRRPSSPFSSLTHLPIDTGALFHPKSPPDTRSVKVNGG